MLEWEKDDECERRLLRKFAYRHHHRESIGQLLECILKTKAEEATRRLFFEELSKSDEEIALKEIAEAQLLYQSKMEANKVAFSQKKTETDKLVELEGTVADEEGSQGYYNPVTKYSNTKYICELCNSSFKDNADKLRHERTKKHRQNVYNLRFK